MEEQFLKSPQRDTISCPIIFLGLGGECSSQADCTVGNSECTGGPPTTCQCSQGYSESGSPPSSCTVNRENLLVICYQAPVPGNSGNVDF